MKLRALRGRILPSRLLAVALAVTSAGVGLVAAPAGAAPSTKYYLSTASQSSLDVSNNPVDPPITFTLTNCGSTTSGCTKASTQSWGSAHVVLPASSTTGWNWGYDTSHGPVTVANLVVHSTDASKTDHWKISDVVSDPVAHTQIVELRNDGTNSAYAIAPGEWLTFTATLTPSPAGLAAVTTEVKQSNDFSGTGNDFLHSGTNTDPTIIIGPPDHLDFVVPPQTVQQTTTVGSTTTYYYMCDGNNQGPSVRVVDKNDHTLTWVQGLAVTLASTDGRNPGLTYKPTTTTTSSPPLTASTANGVATFGSGCTTGLTATKLGVGYLLGASATFNNSVPLSVLTPASFDVLQYYQPCAAVCDTNNISQDHTTVDVQGFGSTTNRLAASVGLLTPISTDCGADATLRSIVSVDLANHTKKLLLSWDKQAVQEFVNNGTPFWDVCMWATYDFVTRGGSLANLATGSTTFYVGVLPDCLDATSPGPCVSSLYRRAGVEYASVNLPNVTGDPQFK